VLLLAQANAVVHAHRLINEIWGDAPPASAANLVQGAVSHLRKVLGKDAIVTRGHGYAVQVEPDALDLHLFERRAQEGSLELERGDFEQAAATLAAAAGLWSGSALADLDGEPCVQPVAVDPPRMRTYLRGYTKAFPGTPAGIASGELVTGYRDAVEAIVRALERAHGDEQRLPAELRRLHIGLLGGPVRLDRRGQAVISISLVRIGAQDRGAATPALEAVSRLDGVDQSVGGLLAPTLSPRAGPAACRRDQPPPWSQRGSDTGGRDD
jgi:hypothetical protein